jgi:hypothetical protein
VDGIESLSEYREGSRAPRYTSVLEDRDDEGNNEHGEDFDPDQPMDERRTIQREIRGLRRTLQENPDQFLQDDPEPLLEYFNKSNKLLDNIKQTSEATIESRGLLIAADLSARRAHRITAEGSSGTIDVDEFVSKCITFMRQGRGILDDDSAELTGTQRRNRNNGSMSNDEDDDGDMLDWVHMGRYACVPHIQRPAVTGFLVGPLSVEKKARKVSQRSAPLRMNNLTETRPEILNPEDVTTAQDSKIITLCNQTAEKLRETQRRSQKAVRRAYEEALKSKEKVDPNKIMERYSLRSTGGVDLFRFVINPHSFSQTVENLFYVSCLIRDDHVKIDYDDAGLPSIRMFNPLKISHSRYLQPWTTDHLQPGKAKQQTGPKRQLIFSLNMKTWRDLIEAYNITEPMIPHRP